MKLPTLEKTQPTITITKMKTQEKAKKTLEPTLIRKKIKINLNKNKKQG